MHHWVLAAAAMAFSLATPAAAAEFEGDFDLAEWHLDSDHSLFLDGTFSYGDEVQKVVAKVTVGGSVGKLLDEVDGQFLYSRAIGGGFSVLGGVRHEFTPSPNWTYAAVGIEGEPAEGVVVESFAFLSEKGDLTGEMKAVVDLPLAPRWTLQPRAVVAWSAQDVPQQGLASGATEMELGLRLRFELADAFAPYIGVSHERLLGRTSSLARAAGDPVRATHVVVGFTSAF